MLHATRLGPAGTPLWKLILKQFDDLLVKVWCCTIFLAGAHRIHSLMPGFLCLQILLVAAVVDFIIAMSEGEGFLR
jgi:hypothetical protein